MSEKSCHSSWISQFGLYRYEDNLLRKRKKQSNICFYGITGTASAIIILVFIFINNTDFEPPKRLIIFSHENKSHPKRFTTSSDFLKQIPSNIRYEDENSFTTPLSPSTTFNSIKDSEPNGDRSPKTLKLKAYRSQYDGPHLFIPNHNFYPNHRSDGQRRMEEVYHPRPFDYILRGTPPTAFQMTNKNPTKYRQLGKVNNIQDILRQLRDSNAGDFHESNGMRKMKIAGTYRHPKIDDITRMFESGHRHIKAQQTDQLLVQPNSIHSSQAIRDPFYKFKPHSLSDVNLMATNQFRFAPYGIANSKLVPLVPTHSETLTEPGSLYNQIIMANNNRLNLNDKHSKTDNPQMKQKPFTLMLDVYPMPDDEHVSTTMHPLSTKFRRPLIPNAMRHPNIGSINNLPMIESSFFHNTRYPQLQGHQYRHTNIPHYHNDMFLKKLSTKQLYSGRSHGSTDADGNNPSQITVHLNLFPKKKDHSTSRTRNLEILNREENILSEKDDTPMSVSGTSHKITAELKDENNQTAKRNYLKSEEISNVRKIANKVDMEAFRNNSGTLIRHNAILTGGKSSEKADASEELFYKEFLQDTTVAPIDLTESSTLKVKSRISSNSDNLISNFIPTIIPIEPREYSRDDNSMFPIHSKK